MIKWNLKVKKKLLFVCFLPCSFYFGDFFFVAHSRSNFIGAAPKLIRNIGGCKSYVDIAASLISFKLGCSEAGFFKVQIGLSGA